MPTTVNYANLVLKDKDGNVGVVRTLTAADVAKVQQVKTDVALIVDATTHTLITADTTTFGATKIADQAALDAGTANLAVDAAAYKALKDAMENGVHYKGSVATFADLPSTNVESGDMYNVQAAFTKDGVAYPAGTNVIASVSGTPATIEWDVLDGDPSGYAKQAVANTFTAANTFNSNVTVAAGAAGDPTPAVNLTGADVTVADAELDTTDAGYVAAAPVNAGVLNSALTELGENIVKYSATEPADPTALDNNTVTFFPGADLLS